MIADPTERVAYLVWRLHHAIQLTLERELEPLDLTLPAFGVLTHLARAPQLSAADLARTLGVSRQALSLVLRGLEGRGLVDRTPAGAGRRRAITITYEGWERLHAAVELVDAVEGRTFGDLDSATRAALRERLLDASARLSERG